jgi:hypothetical protein
MKRLSILVACAVGLLLSRGAGAAQAQARPLGPTGGIGVPGGLNRPAFSPYLNLTRPGGTPALNYYGLVRPEVQFRQSITNLQGGLIADQQALTTLQTDPNAVSPTGHPTQFMNYGGYFLNTTPSQRSGAPAGGTLTRPGLTAGSGIPKKR